MGDHDRGVADATAELGDQLVEALHQFDAGVAVPGHPEGVQDDAAELMDGGDGGGVEVGVEFTRHFGQGVGKTVHHRAHDLDGEAAGVFDQ